MKQLKLDEAVKNLTFGDLKTPFVVGDWTGRNRTEKDRGRVPLGSFGGKGREVVVWFRMCGAPWANDWDNVGSIDFFSTCGFHLWKWYGF